MHKNAYVWIFLLQVPNVKWEDVGGLEDVKKSILDTVQVGFLYDIIILVVTFFPRFERAIPSFYGSVWINFLKITYKRIT